MKYDAETYLEEHFATVPYGVEQDKSLKKESHVMAGMSYISQLQRYMFTTFKRRYRLDIS